MKVGDLVMWMEDETIGIITKVRHNGDCYVQFATALFLVNPTGLEVINASR